MNKSMYTFLSLRDRLLLHSHVDPTGCWLWRGTKFKNTGYGQVTYKRKVYSAHRLSMHVFNGFDLKSKSLILHHCDVKLCVNPSHLYEGDRLDNARDAVERGRQPTGSRHWNAKLDEDKVREIFRLLHEGVSPVDIAYKFGVEKSTVNLIRRRKTWRHVKEKNENVK